MRERVTYSTAAGTGVGEGAAMTPESATASEAAKTKKCIERRGEEESVGKEEKSAGKRRQLLLKVRMENAFAVCLLY